MIRSKRARWAAAGFATVLATTAITAGVPAGAQNTPAFVQVTDAGYLSLQVGATSVRVRHIGPTGTVLETENFAVSSKCEVTGGGRLLTFVSSTGKVGINNNGLGTKTKNNCSTDEGRTGISPELFTVALGSKFTGVPVSIDRVELDIEGKFGSELAWSTNASPATAGQTSLSTNSDNGPDSGIGDNNRVDIGTLGSLADNFTSLSLRATGDKGEVALDGGGDSGFTSALANSKGTYESLFLLVSTKSFEYTVPCGGTVTASSADNQSDQGTVSDSKIDNVVFVRLPNKGTGSCDTTNKLIGLNLQASNGGTTGNADDVVVDPSDSAADGSTQNVRARVQIIWSVETAGKTPAEVEAELARTIDYTPDTTTTDDVPVQWCTSVPSTVAANPLSPSVLDAVGHPAGQAWCLISDQRVMSGTVITQTQIYSGNGDPQWR